MNVSFFIEMWDFALENFGRDVKKMFWVRKL